jgi:hypothetical protein
MGCAYAAPLGDRRDLRLQLYAYAACDDPETARAVRSGYAQLARTAHELSGADGEALFRFFAHGMLLNVMAATDLAADGSRSRELADMLHAATTSPD